MYALVPAILMYTDTEFLQWTVLYSEEMLTNVTWSNHIDGWFRGYLPFDHWVIQYVVKSTLWMILGQLQILVHISIYSDDYKSKRSCLFLGSFLYIKQILKYVDKKRAAGKNFWSRISPVNKYQSNSDRFKYFKTKTKIQLFQLNFIENDMIFQLFSKNTPIFQLFQPEWQP